MSRAIKVEDQVYNELDRLRGKGKTFSQVIEDILGARLKIFELLNVVEGQLKYQDWKQRQIHEVLNK
ncbi:unnamed protein product [marine sediment metagenome]|uniref:Antitoxin n=1 Tax=marine sediment metagenome TaxID=412755 RepID=X1CM08_9ZZZZ